MFFSTAFFYSCEDKDDTSSSTPSTTYTNKFSVKLDGQNYVSTKIYGYKATGLVTLFAESGTKKLRLLFDIDQAVGTYQMHAIQTPIGQYIPDGASYFLSDTGTVTISTHDLLNKIIKGTFSFSAKLDGNSTVYNFTDGSFDIKYK